MTKTSVANTDDLIDIRDVIARVEELENDGANERRIEHPDIEPNEDDEEALRELDTLRELLADCQGNGGDEQWDGDWYPGSLIRDSYFEDYAQEIAEEIGAIPDNAQWPARCIDWEQAARELQMDYTGVTFDGVGYWCR